MPTLNEEALLHIDRAIRREYGQAIQTRIRRVSGIRLLELSHPGGLPILTLVVEQDVSIQDGRGFHLVIEGEDAATLTAEAVDTLKMAVRHGYVAVRTFFVTRSFVRGPVRNPELERAVARGRVVSSSYGWHARQRPPL